MTALKLRYSPGDRKRFIRSIFCNPQCNPPALPAPPSCSKCGGRMIEGVCSDCGSCTSCYICYSVKQPDKSWRFVAHDELKAVHSCCPTCEKKIVGPVAAELTKRRLSREMEPIKIIDKDGTIIAAHTIEHPLAGYGVQVWYIYDHDPHPGPAILFAENISCPIEIIGLQAGWLIIRRSDRRLSGIIWRDGCYYADLLVDENNEPVTEYREGLQVRGTVPVGVSPSVEGGEQ